jgi:hypothetical protein
LSERDPHDDATVIGICRDKFQAASFSVAESISAAETMSFAAPRGGSKILLTSFYL